MRYVFKQLDPYDDNEITFEVNAETMGELLEQFTYFLRACSFVVKYDKELELVSEEDLYCNACNAEEDEEEKEEEYYE